MVDVVLLVEVVVTMDVDDVEDTVVVVVIAVVVVEELRVDVVDGTEVVEPLRVEVVEPLIVDVVDGTEVVEPLRVEDVVGAPAHLPFTQLDCWVPAPQLSVIVCPSYWQLLIDGLQDIVFVPPSHCTLHPVCPRVQQFVHMLPIVVVVEDAVDVDVELMVVDEVDVVVVDI